MNVEKYLDRTNKTASTLADELGLNASSVTAWKKGKATPKLWEAIKTRHAAEFRGEVVLTPEECALIVRNGLRSLRLKDESSEDQQG